MRSRRVVVGALFLLGCGKVTDQARATATPDHDAGMFADAHVMPVNPPNTTWDATLSPPDAGAPVCTVAQDGWVEQKISLGVINRGFWQPLAGDDARLAVLG